MGGGYLVMRKRTVHVFPVVDTRSHMEEIETPVESGQNNLELVSNSSVSYFPTPTMNLAVAVNCIDTPCPSVLK